MAFIAYEAAAGALLVVWAFLGDVGSALRPDMVGVTAGWVRAGAQGFAPGFRRRYMEQIVFEHRRFNVRGLLTRGAFSVELQDVFVPLRVRHRAAHKSDHNPVNQVTDSEAENHHQAIWHFLRSRGQAKGQALAIIGRPGCGKSTMLQHIALTLALNVQRRHGVRARVPLLLFLREHATTILEDEPSLEELTQRHFSRSRRYPQLAPPQRWFARHLERGDCMVLLDGLDEIPGVEQRRAVARWVDTQIANYRKSQFVMTARPQGYQAAQLENADVLEVLPFRASDVREFVRGWYLANEIVASGQKKDKGVAQAADANAEDLLRRLRDAPALHELTVNPLLLSMIAIVHRYRAQLPGRRVELYSEICDVFLGHWQQAKGMAATQSASQRRRVLEPLAASLSSARRTSVTILEAESVVAPVLERIGYQGGAGSPVEQFFHELEDASGLLLETAPGRWSFAHKTFQEYLTVCAWKHAPPGSWESLVADSWWHEMLRLFAAQNDSTELVKTCLAARTVGALSLMSIVIEEAAELEPTVRQEARALLFDGLESDDQSLGRLAADVQLATRLKGFARIDDDRSIDTRWLTCSEYQLFVEERAVRGREFHVDHWAGPRFAKGNATEPVSGVRASDVAEFCMWLTERTGGAARFRLPTPEELSEVQLDDSSLAAWCRTDDGETVLVGLSAQRQDQLKTLIGTRARTWLNSTKSLNIPALDLMNDEVGPADEEDRFHTRLSTARGRILRRALSLSTALPIRELELELDRALRLERTNGDSARTAPNMTNETVVAIAPANSDAQTIATRLLTALSHTFLGATDVAVLLEETLARPPSEDSLAIALMDAAKQLSLTLGKPATGPSSHRAFVEMVGALSRLEHGGDFVSPLSARGAESDSYDEQHFALRIAAAALGWACLESTSYARRARLQFRLELIDAFQHGSSKERGTHDIGATNVPLSYWKLRLCTARMDNEIPAWEGIRLVRDQSEANTELLREWHLPSRTRFVKRLIDITCALVGIVFLSPALLLFLLLMRLDSHGEPFYRQRRIGRDGIKFRALKFRTMHIDADARLADYLQNHPESRKEYEQLHFLAADPRVTRLGRFLRKYNLDELPLLWNVLSGEMSLVGPRPYLDREIPEMAGREGIILQVSPGLTGPWQVSERRSFKARVNMDIRYVQRWSLLKDVKILIKTVAFVLRGQGT